MSRLSFEFNGSTTRNLTLDPAEFVGQPVEVVTRDIMKTMKDIAPDVNFFPSEIALAAHSVHDAAAGL